MTAIRSLRDESADKDQILSPNHFVETYRELNGTQFTPSMVDEWCDYLDSDPADLLILSNDIVGGLVNEADAEACNRASIQQSLLDSVYNIVSREGDFPQILVNSAKDFILRNCENFVIPPLQQDDPLWNEYARKLASTIGGLSTLAFRTAVERADQNQIIKTFDIFKNNFTQAKNMQQGKFRSDFSLMCLFYYKTEQILEGIPQNEENMSFIQDYVSSVFNDRLYLLSKNIIRYGLEHRNKFSKVVKGEVVKLISDNLGADYSEVISAWVQNSTFLNSALTDKEMMDSFAGKISECLAAINRLESKSPGAAKLIYENCGILNFERYTLQQLLKQAELLRNKESYYANIDTVVYEHSSDSVGAFEMWGIRSLDILNKIGEGTDDYYSPSPEEDNQRIIFLAGSDSKKMFKRLANIADYKTRAYEKERHEKVRREDWDTDVKEFNWIVIGAHSESTKIGDIDFNMLTDPDVVEDISTIKLWFKTHKDKPTNNQEEKENLDIENSRRTAFILNGCNSAQTGMRSIAAKLSYAFETFVYGSEYYVYSNGTRSAQPDLFFTMPQINQPGVKYVNEPSKGIKGIQNVIKMMINKEGSKDRRFVNGLDV